MRKYESSRIQTVIFKCVCTGVINISSCNDVTCLQSPLDKQNACQHILLVFLK